MDEFNDWVIQPQKRSDLKYAIDLILDFNEELNQIWFKKYKKRVSYFQLEKHSKLLITLCK